MAEVEVVDIRKISGDGALKAMADVKVAETVVIRGLTVVKGRNGVFVSMPRKASRDGKWFDIVTPISDELRREFEGKVLEAYDREVDGVRE